MHPFLTLLALILLCATSLPADAQSSDGDEVSGTTRSGHEWDAAGKEREREKRLKMEAEKDEEIARLKKQLEPEEEEPDFHLRTLGQACMHGADGSVLYRPKGALCKGDRPPAAPANAVRKRRAAAGKVRTGGQRGRCFYGAENRIIYAPPGVDCRR